jgi:hypothetical protein
MRESMLIAPVFACAPSAAAIDLCSRRPCQHDAGWWLEEEAVKERLAVETARRNDPYAAARALFTREDPHA